MTTNTTSDGDMTPMAATREDEIKKDPKFATWFQEYKAVSKLELEYLLHWRIYVGILFAAVMQFIHNLCHNYVYYLAWKYNVYGGPDNQLTDMGFIGLEDTMRMDFAPNFCLYLVAAISIALGFSIFFTRKLISNPSVHIAQMAWRACMVTCITIPLRCISFLVTILPAPADHCSPDLWSPPETAYEIFTWFDVGGSCSDLIFSSHMMYGLIATLTITHYTIMGLRGMPSTQLERSIKYSIVGGAWFIVFYEGLAIIRQRVHYSIDVFTAGYVVPLVWLAFYHFVPMDPVPPKYQAKNEIVNNTD
jgi:hypothetical protein